jgi:hypothetical protein
MACLLNNPELGKCKEWASQVTVGLLPAQNAGDGTMAFWVKDSSESDVGNPRV